MADPTAAGEDAPITFNVKSSSGPKISVSVPLSTTVADLKTKLAESDMANVPVPSQRLIYSGKVLKDTETLETYKVKEGNTIHLVRTAASNERQNPSSQAAAPTSGTTANPTSSAVPQNFAAGTGNDPLAGLTGARYAGFHGLPSLESLAHPPSPDEMLRRLQDPNFAQQLNEALQNPQLIDMMINQNPQLRAMGPQARQMLQSESFRNMMTNPDHMRAMLEMQRAMGQDPFGGAGGGQEAFPMPGATTTTDQQHQNQGQTQNAGQPQNQQNPFASMFGGNGGGMNPFMFMPPPPQTQDRSANPAAGTQPANPFAALFNPAMGQQQTPSTQSGAAGTTAGNETSTNTGAGAQQNPFGNMFNNPMLQQMLNNPEAMRNAMQMMQSSGIDPFAMLGGGVGGAGGAFGAPAPADNRPPEERYATQLGQLNEMGFYNFDQNIQALTRSGGDVNGALEWLFSQPPS